MYKFNVPKTRRAEETLKINDMQPTPLPSLECVREELRYLIK